MATPQTFCFFGVVLYVLYINSVETRGGAASADHSHPFVFFSFVLSFVGDPWACILYAGILEPAPSI